MNRILTTCTESCLARPLAVLLSLLVAVTCMSAGLVRLGFDNRPDTYFIKGDESVADWLEFKDQYGSDEFSFIVLSPETADLAFVETLRNLTDRLMHLDAAERVTSLVNVRSIKQIGNDLDVDDYLSAARGEEETLARLASAHEHPYYGGLFVSRDGKHFGILLETDPNISNHDKAVLTAELRAILQGEPYSNYAPRAIGAPVLDADVQRIVGAESSQFGLLTMALVLIGFAVAYRSWIGVVLPVAVAVPSIMMTLGGMGHFGVPAGLLTPIIPSFLISVGLGSSVYLLSKYHILRRRGVANLEAIRATIHVTGKSAVLANATTALALFAFSSSRVLPVQHVGIALGVGLLIALVLTLAFFPVLALWLGNGIARKYESEKASQSRVLALVGQWVLERPAAAVAGFVVLVSLGILGTLQLKTDYYYLGTFKESTSIVRDYASAAMAIPVSNSIEVVIESNENDLFRQPEVLRALDALAEDAVNASDPGLPLKVYSLADVVKELSGEMLGTYSIPDDRPTIAQLLLLFESSGTDELTRLTTANYDQVRLTFMVPARPYGGYVPVIETITSEGPRLFAQAGAPDVTITVTGVVPLWLRISQFLTETQISSFVLAATMVALIMVLIVRRFALGLAMAAVNLGCVTMVLGAMGWLGIMLDPFTILIGAIAIGILDDDTIHFTVSALSRIDAGQGPRAAIADTYQGEGRAMGLQSLVLVVAFLVYTLSSVASLTLFGAITAVIIVIGLVAEYFVTSAVIFLVFRNRAPWS